MIEYTTLANLRSFNSQVILQERATMLRKAEERSPAGSTFLSHSSKDTEFLPGLILLLENHGAQVYIDKKDEKIPPYTSRETAMILRSRVGDCKKFLLFATTNSKDSRWMPWELGLADGLKSSSGVAVFPGVDTVTDTSWTEQEYLGVYSRVVWGDLEGESEKVWMVLNQEANTATTLSQWLRD
jgi:hypothetical protein